MSDRVCWQCVAWRGIVRFTAIIGIAGMCIAFLLGLVVGGR